MRVAKPKALINCAVTSQLSDLRLCFRICKIQFLIMRLTLCTCSCKLATFYFKDDNLFHKSICR